MVGLVIRAVPRGLEERAGERVGEGPRRGLLPGADLGLARRGRVSNTIACGFYLWIFSSSHELLTTEVRLRASSLAKPKGSQGPRPPLLRRASARWSPALVRELDGALPRDS